MILTGAIVSTTAERFATLRDFYAGLFGDHVRTTREGFVSFEWPDLRLTVTLHSAIAGEAVEPQRVMLNFATADIGQAFDLAVTLGARIVRRPVREHWGGLVATVADPDGNYIQFLEF